MATWSTFDALYARYWGVVVAYLRGQGADDPEDLASETFVGVLRGLDRFHGDEAALRSWILVIAHRRLVDQRRSAARRPSAPTEPHVLQALVDRAHRHEVDHEVLARLGSDSVHALLGSLTADQRTVFVLHDLEDRPLTEVARMMGRRIGAVKSLHQRARAAALRAMTAHADWRGATATT